MEIAAPESTYNLALPDGNAKNESEKGLDEMMSQYGFREKIAYGFAMSYFFVAILTILYNPFVSGVIAASVCGTGTVAVMAHSQHELHYVANLKKIETRLKREITFLLKENERLEEQVDLLKITTSRLEDLLKVKKKITELNKNNVHDFAKQVVKMRSLKKMMQTSINDDILRYIVDAAIKFDVDASGNLSKAQGRKIIKRVQKMYGVPINEERFLDIVVRRGSIRGIVKSIRNRDNTQSSENKIFAIKDSFV